MLRFTFGELWGGLKVQPLSHWILFPEWITWRKTLWSRRWMRHIWWMKGELNVCKNLSSWSMDSPPKRGTQEKRVLGRLWATPPPSPDAALMEKHLRFSQGPLVCRQNQVFPGHMGSCWKLNIFPAPRHWPQRAGSPQSPQTHPINSAPP